MKYAAIPILALLAPQVAHAAPLERHPYLQCAAPDEMTVVWTTVGDSTGSVAYGTELDSLDQTADSTVTDTQHEVRITGLSPNTKYYYEVISDDEHAAGGDAFHYFVTPPPTGSEEKIRAWIVGDSGTGGFMQGAVRDAMLAHVGLGVPDIYLHMGDMAYSDGTETEFTNRFFAMYANVLRNTTTWPTMGNHEGHSSTSATQSGPYYYAYVLPTGGEAGGVPSGTEAYYSFDHGNAHFIILDSHQSDRDVDAPMLTWAAADIAATDQQWVIAYWHHPPYTKGSHDSDDEGALIDMRENALPILEAGGVDLVLGGHSHIYERSFLLDGAYQTPSMAGVGVLDASDGKAAGDGPYRKSPGLPANDGAVYVVAGHGGTGVSGPADHPLMYFSEVQNGSCLLDIQGNRLSLINIRHDGEVTDNVSIIKGDGIIITAPDGGETLAANSDFEITWTTVGDIANVRLEYSVTDGAQWTTIEDSVPNTGSFTWEVPELDSGLGLVKVTDVSDEDTFDESNAVFRMSANAPIDVIQFGDEWRYHDMGIDLGAGWQDASFDDAAWPEGPGQLGYGDGDEATMLIDAEPNHPSAYFRKTFEVDGTVIDGELTVLFDDGAAVWLNGMEVFAANVADGTDYATYASGSSDDNATSTVPVLGPHFIDGENTIAVMVKQSSPDSSDLSFDLALSISIASDPPEDPGDDTGTGDDGGPDTTSGGNGGTTAPLTTGDVTTGMPGSGVGSDGDTDTAGATEGGGCSCRSVPGSAPASWLFLLVLPWLRRRR